MRAEGLPESNGETGVRKVIMLLYYFGGDDQSESRYDGHVLTVQKSRVIISDRLTENQTPAEKA